MRAIPRSASRRSSSIVSAAAYNSMRLCGSSETRPRLSAHSIAHSSGEEAKERRCFLLSSWLTSRRRASSGAPAASCHRSRNTFTSAEVICSSTMDEKFSSANHFLSAAAGRAVITTCAEGKACTSSRSHSRTLWRFDGGTSSTPSTSNSPLPACNVRWTHPAGMIPASHPVTNSSGLAGIGESA